MGIIGTISILCAACIRGSAGAVVLQPSMRTFGNALKSFPVKAGHEQVRYSALLLGDLVKPRSPGRVMCTAVWLVGMCTGSSSR